MTDPIIQKMLSKYQVKIGEQTKIREILQKQLY